MKNFIKNIDWKSMVKPLIILLIVTIALGGYALYKTFSRYTVETVIEGGGFTSGTGNYRANDDVTLIATPKEGYVFLGWYKDGYTDVDDKLTDEPSYSFIMPSSSVKYVAVFVLIT